MRIRLVLHLLGRLMTAMGAIMLLPLICTLYYQDGDFSAILITMLVYLAVGGALLLIFKNAKETLRQREGFLFAAVSWLIAALIGSLPYLLSGVCTDFFSAFFESMSGFTTTGATVFGDVESLPHGVLFWRSLTQWLGGLGIAVLFVAVLFGSHSTASGSQIYKAESPGNSLAEHLTSRITTNSKILWVTYIALTGVLFILLKLGGMGFFDSACHSLSTLATGGFSTKNASVGAFADSAFIQWVITLFMFWGGTNLAFFYILFIKRKNMFLLNEEFRVYCYILLGATLLTFGSFLIYGTYDGQSIEFIFRQAAFQVVSITTTTGFTVGDYTVWPPLAQMILFTLMFVGACSGSTSGSVKVVRIMTLFKNTLAEFKRMVHPKAITTVKINKKPINQSILHNTIQFFVIFILLFFIGVLVMSALGLDFIDSISVTAASLGNIGPAHGTYGPLNDYSSLPAFGKIFLSLYMLIGRLEIYTVLVLLAPSVWKK